MAKNQNFKTRHRLIEALSDDTHDMGSEGDTSSIPLPQTSEVESDESWQSTRPAKVARARTLAADPDYPSRALMDSVAKLLEDKLNPRSER